ncbi:MAG: hypothetical protein VXA68_10385 [Gammaproteobacteria bacterium]
MKKLIALLSVVLLSATAVAARDFTRSDTSLEFCKDIVNNLVEVGVGVSHKSMTKCSLLVLGGASASFKRSYGDPLNVVVKSNPYRMFLTRGDNEIGTCYVLHPRKTTRKVKDKDC